MYVPEWVFLQEPVCVWLPCILPQFWPKCDFPWSQIMWSSIVTWWSVLRALQKCFSFWLIESDYYYSLCVKVQSRLFCTLLLRWRCLMMKALLSGSCWEVHWKKKLRCIKCTYTVILDGRVEELQTVVQNHTGPFGSCWSTDYSFHSIMLCKYLSIQMRWRCTAGSALWISLLSLLSSWRASPERLVQNPRVILLTRESWVFINSFTDSSLLPLAS